MMMAMMAIDCFFVWRNKTGSQGHVNYQDDNHVDKANDVKGVTNFEYRHTISTKCVYHKYVCVCVCLHMQKFVGMYVCLP